jgi:very-short-patch-repair endonuclease
VRATLLAATAANGGVIGRRQALAVVARHVLADAVTDGALTRIFPSVYALPEAASRIEVRRHGALIAVPDSALSHLDGLGHWGLPGEPRDVDDLRIHVTHPGGRNPVEVAGIRAHRRRGFHLGAPHTVVRLGAHVVRMEQAIIESWPLLAEVDQRLPAIVAVRDRRTRGQRLLACLDRQPKTAGAREMRELFELNSRAQVPVRLPNGRKVYLDRLFEDELVNVELDGAAYHGKPGQRERDLRRDAALAALGYVTVRFSHLRLHADPEGCVLELLAILATRRRQLGLQPA